MNIISILAKKYNVSADLQLVKPLPSKPAKPEVSPPDFSQAKYWIEENRAFGTDNYVLTCLIPVNKVWLNKTGKGKFVNLLHEEGIESQLDMWLGTPMLEAGVGNQRAKGGMVSVKVSWELKDNIEAYALGANTAEWRSRSEVVKSKEQYEARKKFATAMIDKITKFRTKAIEILKKRNLDKEAEDKAWKEEYLPTLQKMLKEAEGKGLSYSKSSLK